MNALVVADEDTFEHLFREWEAAGVNPTLMRETRDAIAAMPTGDPTPVPGALLRDATLLQPPVELAPLLPPMHQGLYDTPEGPFAPPRIDAFIHATMPPRHTGEPEKHVTLRGLSRELRRVRRVAYAGLAALTFVVVLAIVVARWNW